MYLLYVDESGSPGNAGEHFVVGGLAVHESDVEPLRRALQRIVDAYLHPHLAGLELHAQPLRSNRKPWSGIPRQVKAELLKRIPALLGSFKPPSTRPYSLFAVVKAPSAVPQADPLERCFEELFLRFTQMLVRMKKQGDEQFGIAVADRARYESTLQPVVRKWREVGTRFAKLTRMVDVPLFVDSSATRLIQLADFVAHGVFRMYQAGDDSLFAPLLPAFDEANGVKHGLVHLTSGYLSCSCPACAPRAAKAAAKLKVAKTSA